METLMSGPLHFYQLAYISILSTACYSLPERSVRGPPLNLQMKSHNFQHVLSWQAGSDLTVPTHYRVLYTDRSKWKTAEQCSDITQLLCNLTEDFKDVSIQYSTLVQSFVGTEVFNSSAFHFMPFTDTFLGPPEVNISSCPNCINITVKLPTSHFRKNEKLLSLIDIYEELDYEIILKTRDGQHKVFINTLAYSPFIFESEEITSVEIISKEVKKKAKECSGYGSDEDDDDESNDRSNHDYTRRDVLSRVPCSSDTSSAFVQCCTESTCENSSSQASQNPDTDLEDFEENEVDIEEDKGASTELINPFSEENCTSSSGSRNSACFTINLKTVLLGTSEENEDSSAALLSYQEDKVDWQDSGAFESELLDDTGSVQKPLCHNVSHEWQNSSSSDESDSSDPDMDQKTEYIRR
ncbi:interferon alpha/beta receptor 2 isoform X2 [Apteryx mantelli]|uniref:Interferon alpha/beta receptor 2 isoform X2 n=1 Tax=Apteryx mantelli TaxID=2696672 RepID=A0ABM4ERG1_9AVES